MRKKFKVIYIAVAVIFICIAVLMYMAPAGQKWIPPVGAVVLFFFMGFINLLHDEIFDNDIY